MNEIAQQFSALILQSWDKWWFPGATELLNMIAIMFWWGFALLAAAFILAPILILLVVWLRVVAEIYEMGSP